MGESAEVARTTSSDEVFAADTDLQALRNGDERAFGDLVQRHQRAMHRYAFRLTGSVEMAEEVVQETWIAVLRNIGRYEGRSSLRTWIFQILVNTARTRLRREFVVAPRLALDETALPSDGDRSGWGQHERIEWAEELRAVIVMLNELPALQRTVLVLRTVDELSSVDVTDRLGIQPSYQRVLQHRARARLTQQLAVTDQSAADAR